jgi:hypothetical protein
MLMPLKKLPIRLSPEQMATCVIKIEALLRMASASETRMRYGYVAYAIGLLDSPEDWKDNSKRARARSDLTSVMAATSALGVQDNDLWRWFVDQNGNQGNGYHRTSIVVEAPLR